jgi:hypothetical protein
MIALPLSISQKQQRSAPKKVLALREAVAWICFGSERGRSASLSPSWKVISSSLVRSASSARLRSVTS